MTRRSFRKPVVTLSLFPFLAVLVCTMGALIVLLVAVLQKARVDAADVSESQSNQALAQDERLAELRTEKEDLEWRRSELERQRSEFQQQLVRQRLTLSHFEDHIRSLEAQWKQLSGQAEELKRLGSQQVSSSDGSQDKLLSLRDQIEKEQHHLAEAKRQAAGRQRAFAIIPYDGPNGTKRRPIYIECTDQGIILQPEGVVLAPVDFEGSLGPGNPLDAALRTTREYLAKYSATVSPGEPYPLLIVRPTGTVAYAVARAALRSWDDEFGYELIEADMKLAYPKPDAALKSELERSIADARQRQVVLATIMPGRFKQSGATGLVATTSGGFTAVGGSSASARATGSGGGSGGGSNSGLPGGATTQPGASFTKTFREVTGGVEERTISMGAAQRSLAQSNGSRTGPGGSGMGQSPTIGSANGSSQNASNSNSATSATSASSNSNAPPGQVGQPGSSGNSTQFASGRPGESSGSTGGNPGSRNKKAGSGGKAPPGTQPLANDRGSDWGLPNRGSTSTGIQRYLQVECRSDQLVLLYERGDYREPTVIPMPGETATAIDPFVSATWKRMEQWGIAGDGCFWKPILRVQVSPGAEQRFAELATLLQGSGLVIERKN